MRAVLTALYSKCAASLLSAIQCFCSSELLCASRCWQRKIHSILAPAVESALFFICLIGDVQIWIHQLGDELIVDYSHVLRLIYYIFES